MQISIYPIQTLSNVMRVLACASSSSQHMQAKFQPSLLILSQHMRVLARASYSSQHMQAKLQPSLLISQAH